MQTGTKRAPIPLHVLLVGSREEDFFLIREILERNHSTLAAELEHARTIEEAHEMLQGKAYGLIVFESNTGDTDAVTLVSHFHRAGISIPFILLTEDADERTVADAIGRGT